MFVFLSLEHRCLLLFALGVPMKEFFIVSDIAPTQDVGVSTGCIVQHLACVLIL